ERRCRRLYSAPLADAARYGRIAKDSRPRHAWRDFFEQLQPFSADAVVEREEPSRVAARPRQAVDEAGTDRIGYDREHNRHAASDLQQRPRRRAAGGEDDLRLESGELGRISACDLVIAAGPPVFDLDILPDGPAQLLQPLKKRRIAPLRDGIVCCERHEHADAPHARRLLAVGRDRPRDRRATDKPDELATFHVPSAPPALPSKG